MRGNKTGICKFYKYKDGTLYQGEVVNGKKQGKGKLTSLDATLYEGQFENDKIKGEGVLLLPDGLTVYRGNFEGEKFHGKGVLYNSRFKYEG